jgi:hypothetical protein
MIEVVDRFKAEEQGRVAVRLEDDGGKQGGLETVRAPLADDAPEAAQGGPPAGFLVVGQRVEVLLDGARRPQPGDQAPLPEREAGSGSRLQPAPLYSFPRSASTCSGDQSLPVYAFTSLPSASMIAVRRLCVMSRRSVSDRATDTPNREAN